MKIRILRRAFDPKPGEPKVSTTVAIFQSGCEAEAAACLAWLQSISTSFSDQHTPIQKYRYAAEQIFPPPLSPALADAEVQVDVSKAKPTGRPLAIDVGWEVKHGKCHIRAYHRFYGVIRGIVPDSVDGRKMFYLRVASVWPKAQS